MDYYRISVGEAFKVFESSENGLSDEQAETLFLEVGPNEIKETKKVSAIRIFLEQFKSVLIFILFIAMIISIVLRKKIEAITILAILILNAILGFIQEYRAERAIEALKKMASVKAHVIRGNEVIEIESRNVVPGDILVLETGAKIAADARIIESVALETQEASLTGESVPVKKQTKTLRKRTPIADQSNMVFSGTIVTRGHGKALVTATGMNTEIGKIAELVEAVGKETTPLQERLAVLGKQLGIITLVVCFIVAFVGVIKRMPIESMLMTALSLAVSAIPEGLPVVVTVCLALGLQRMLKRNALIRRLRAVETLGCTTVICSDKTGTLTKNEMTVKKIFVNNKVVDVSGIGYNNDGSFSLHPKGFELLLRIGALNNDAHFKDSKIIGDPTEGCLLVSAAKAGLVKEELEREYPRIGEIPFEPERKMMTTLHKTPKGNYAYTKGAPDVVVKICNKILINGKEKKLSLKDKKLILSKNKEFAKDALRVLGFAYKKLGKRKEKAEKNMVFVGLQAMIDPPRPEVKEAIKKCEKAGIKVVMITGDFKDTAVAIAKELGIKGKAITGEQLDKIKKLVDVVEDIGVYARVNPEHKMRIIDALEARGHIVAMTGDGVNDAPALKKADIGIAMGITGTDVTKEASEMILVDDNFASIVNAVEEGRVIYDNIKKFIKYLLSVNFSEIGVITFSLLIGLPLPLLPLQILWLNLVTDSLPALALGVEPAERDVMTRKPRNPKEGILRGLGRFMLAAGFFAFLATLIVFVCEYSGSGSLIKARTMAVTTSVMFEMLFVFTCMSDESLLKRGPLINKWLIGAVGLSILLHLILIYTPLGVFFDLVSLAPMDWAKIMLLASTGIILFEAKKLIKLKR